MSVSEYSSSSISTVVAVAATAAMLAAAFRLQLGYNETMRIFRARALEPWARGVVRS